MHNTPEDLKLWAHIDRTDVLRAQALVLINPLEFMRKGTGGRHVEFAIAYENHVPCVVFGIASNIFHHLDGVRHALSVERLIDTLKHLI